MNPKTMYSGFFALALTAGCGSPPPPQVTTVKDPQDTALAGEFVGPDGAPAPAWVTQPAKYKPSGEPLLCGEGSVAGAKNISLAQSGAQGRARTALARMLEVKVKAMLKDYQASVSASGGAGSVASDEQAIVDASKQITNTTLQGTEVLETWVSSKGTLHALVCLNVPKFKAALASMSQVNEKLKKAVEQRAEKAWAEIDAETGGN